MKHSTGTIAEVKLLIDPEQPRPLYLPQSTTKINLSLLGKHAMNVVADFIGAMYKHAMTQIEAQSDRDYLAMCQKSFVLTVPAVWSDKAKDTIIKVSTVSYNCFAANDSGRENGRLALNHADQRA